METTSLALLLLVSQVQDHHQSPRDPRTQALRTRDALYSLPNVTGAILPVPDCDRDGLADLAIARGGTWPKSEVVDLVSSKRGALIRTLGKLPIAPSDSDNWAEPAVWDSGGDVDGDHYPELIVGDPSADGSLGRMTIVSGKDGSAIAEIRGVTPSERFGASVAFLGDLNGDGRDDFAVGAEEFDPDLHPELPTIASYQSTNDGSGERRFVVFSDGTRVTQEEYDELFMSYRSKSGGFVSVRSGKDRSELWRVSGKGPGHAFGTHLRAIGDLDEDGKVDLLVQSDLRAPDPLVLLSGARGKEIQLVAHQRGLAGPAGNLDGDGVPDLFLDRGNANTGGRFGGADFISGKSRRSLFALSYPDMWSEYGVTVAMGDLDGDGIDDIALGDGNFNLRGPGGPGYQAGEEVDLSSLSLEGAMRLVSDPWCAFTWESGCAVLYSGRTRKPIFGVWAEPGSREGLGVAVCPLPDISGDGWPDVLVANGTTAYAFRGPGAEKK